MTDVYSDFIIILGMADQGWVKAFLISHSEAFLSLAKLSLAQFFVRTAKQREYTV